MRGLATLLAIAGLALATNAQVRISEAMVNPPGSPDAGREFIEIQSCRPNFSLQGYWLIGIDGDLILLGDVVIVNPGNIHWAIDLSNYSTGANGLLLVRDGTSTLLPEPAAETTVASIVNAFTEAGMGNDSYTVALVRGFTGQPGDDIDTNDDGIIDNVLWQEAVHAFGWTDGEPTGRQYAEQLNGVNIPEDQRLRQDNTVWEPDGIIFFQNGSLIACDIGRATGAGDFGPFQTSNSNRVIIGTLPSQFNREVTPGNLNPGDKPAIEGDVNCDRCVDDADLLQVLFNFGGNDAASDVNGDGIVDDADLLIVLFNFGSGC